ncbi:hypothetical protein [Xylophilus sp.]|uniref:hypothetical protein n=1 Tax=Xylophilus sp. TaxID=2653893 RepID=UPI0013BCBE9C|nr:hypothetical protein [Xylophilus sp.]KAF1044941.1 MAG: hypothetical protein GAK38_03292 [Xylophilus sp.]
MRLAIASISSFTLPSPAAAHALSRAARAVRQALRGLSCTPRSRAPESATPSPAPAAVQGVQPAQDAPQPIVLALGQPPQPRTARRGVRVCRAAAGGGRMVISGRMDEVCAELERLARCEAASA